MQEFSTMLNQFQFEATIGAQLTGQVNQLFSQNAALQQQFNMANLAGIGQFFAPSLEELQGSITSALT
jgi:hypothetical protein